MIRQHIKGDFFGGLTAAIVALPLALAFGVASGAGAIAGLYGAIFTGFFAALFGGTSTQITGPTGPMTVVMALVITHFSGNLALAFCAVILAGGFQIVFGLSGIGRFIKLVPHPVVSGFMSGIGGIIIIIQIAPLLGHTAPGGSILTKLAALPEMFTQPGVHALTLSAITLLIMFATPRRLATLIPPALIAVLVGTLAGVFYFSSAPIIGEIPSGFPSLTVPNITLGDLPVIIRFALILAFLGAIDSLLTSLVADSMTRTHHDSNRELIGQGIGNVVAGLFGGVAGAGATMRTLVNIRSGGTTRLAGIFHAIILLLLVLGFSGAASQIPLAVLGGILIKVGVDIIDWSYLKRMHQAPRAGVIIMLATLLTTIFVDLITAVAVGIVMASLLFVSRMAEAQLKSAKLADNSDELPNLSPEEAEILDKANGQIMLFHMEGPLSFGSARDITKLLLTSGEKEVLVIDLSDVPFIDSSASFALGETIRSLHQQDDLVMIFGARPDVVDILQSTGTLAHLDSQHIFEHRLEALTKANELLAEHYRKTLSSETET